MTEFNAILDRVKLVLNVKNDSEVAELIGLKQSAFANRKKKGSIPLSLYVKALEPYKVNLNWLVYGDGPIYKDELQEAKPQKQSSESVQQFVIEHIDVVHEFEDQEEALDANKNLVTLERLDSEEFYATTGRLRGKVKKLLKQKGISGRPDDIEETASLIIKEKETEKKMS